MGKKIVLLSDGTGNAAAKVWRTNVWRVFESLDLSTSDQIAFYDDGVGTSSFKPLALLGGAFGVGLKRNVLDLYKFVCRNYRTKEFYKTPEGQQFNIATDGTQKPATDDEIFAFGFSRGAFTIRVVVGLICDQGLVKYRTEEELDRKAVAAYRAYRRQNSQRTILRLEVFFRAIRDLFVSGSHDRNERPISQVRFLGVWDTVAAYGLPVDEMTRGISRWLWPLGLPDRQLSEKVTRACHAVCLDDERTTFHPLLWDESNQPLVDPDPKTKLRHTMDERISQVWFAGVHSNVGGGYPDDSLANVSLNWIMNEAKVFNLKFKEEPQAEPDALKRARSSQDKDGRLYDSRAGLGGYYRYGPRKVEEFCDARFSKKNTDQVRIKLPKIHESVFGRIRIGAHLYAPIGLPKKYAVVRGDGTIHLDAPEIGETSTQADERYKGQESIWNFVWQRRAVYFLTVLASLNLLFYPLYRVHYPFEELTTRLRFVSDAIRLVGSVVPAIGARWVDAYARDPGFFLVSAGLVALLIWVGSKKQAQITDEMRQIWSRAYVGMKPTNGLPAKAGSGWSFGRIIWCLLMVFLVYVAIYPLVEKFKFLEFLALPAGWDSHFKKFTAVPIRFIVIVFLIVYWLPASIVQWLRTRKSYQCLIRTIKLKLAPAFFAFLFVYLGFGFANHYLFNIRDGLGDFCKQTLTSEGKPLSVNRHGLRTCKDENLARCDRTPNRLAISSPPISCPANCEEKTLYFDASSTQEAYAKSNGGVCFTTGIMLERGGSYLITVQPKEQTVDSNGAMIDVASAWTYWGVKSTTGGMPLVEFPGWKRLVMFALFPFKRTFDRPWGAVIVRFGSTGNEESFLDPDPVPAKSGFLSEVLKPGRDGELFVYLNKPMLGIWGLETIISDWPIIKELRGIGALPIENRGKMKITLKKIK